MTSFKHDVFLAEEIGREVAKNISIPSQPDTVIKTEETRPTTASIINHHLNNANQWYEIKLPRDAITWQLRCRNDYNVLYSYSPTHTTYFTLRSGEVLSADTSPNAEINAVYLMCETAEVVCELEVWRR